MNGCVLLAALFERMVRELYRCTRSLIELDFKQTSLDCTTYQVTQQWKKSAFSSRCLASRIMPQQFNKVDHHSIDWCFRQNPISPAI